MERIETAVHQAAVTDVVDILLKVGYIEPYRVNRQAVTDELLLKIDPLTHGLAQVIAELFRPDVGVLHHQFIEKLAQEVDVI